MNELMLAIASLIAGVLATILVSKHYFQKSVKKSLTPYVQYYSSPFEGVDATVKEHLSINYQGRPVNQLFEVQYLIANTGEKAIRDVIEPLSLTVPENCELLDAAILHKQPNETPLTIETQDRRIRLVFPLLNAGDFFILKLLLNGEFIPRETNFSILVDELPPTLKPERLDHDELGTASKKKFELPALVAGVAFLIVGLSLAKLVSDTWDDIPALPLAFETLSRIVTDFELLFRLLSVIIGVIPTFICLVSGTIIAALAFTGGSFPPTKTKFIVPDDKQLLRRNWPSSFVVTSSKDALETD